jgi:hypothetical protein
MNDHALFRMAPRPGLYFFLGNETPTARKAEFRGIGDVGRRRRHDYEEIIKVSWSIPRA